MITNYEELTGEQIEAISELAKLHYVKRYRSAQGKGSAIYRKLVKSKVVTNGVSEVDISWFKRSSGKYLVTMRSPRKNFVKMEITEEQYDQLIGVI